MATPDRSRSRGAHATPQAERRRRPQCLTVVCAPLSPRPEELHAVTRRPSRSNRVAELRSVQRLTLRQLACQLGTGPTGQMIKRWERGELAIPDTQQLALADLFGVSVAWLMCGEDAAVTC